MAGAAQRDMSEKQFRAALQRHGMKLVGFLGYVDIGNGVSVSMLNAGTINHRAILAYLLRKQSEFEARASR